MPEPNVALDFLSNLSGAVNAKDAFLRLLDKCREMAQADGAAALKPHTTRRGHEIVLTLGRPLKPDYLFSTSVDLPGLPEREVTHEKDELIFSGTHCAANLELRHDGPGPVAIIRLEWEKPEAMALETLRRLREALPYVAPLIDHLKKYDSKISVHPASGEFRFEEIDIELDTPDLRTLWRKIFNLLAGKLKLEAVAFLRREGNELVLDPGALVGRADPLPPRIARDRETAWLFEAFEEPKPNFPGANEAPKKAAAVPILYKRDALALAVLIGGRSAPSADDVNTAREILDQASLFVRKALLYRKTKIENTNTPLILVGVPRDILELAESYADADAPILIKGETGTGKESVARFLHMIGPRNGKPFLAFNCAELVDTLAESILFGHVKGSFTGATHDTQGIFEQANGGTLFLDEIHLLTPPLQAKFLRAIETGEVRPVGSSGAVRRPDVRIIVATNRELQELVAQGKFLHDLYMRLDVLEVLLPPLRQNRHYLMKIAAAILTELAERNKKQIEGFTPRAKQALLMYDYPGNIRELKNILEKAVVMTKDRFVDADALPAKLLKQKNEAPSTIDLFEPDYESYKTAAERAYLVKLLERAQGSVTEAARMSGLHRTHIYNLMKKHDLNPDRFKA